MQQIHGGDWAGYRAEYGAMPLDFSANISPLGVPEGVRRAVSEAVCSADRYPDPLCRALCAGIGEHHHVPPSWILCGSGAADLIYRLALALQPRRALITAPTFGEYEQALHLTGCAVQKWPLRPEEGFALAPAFLEALVPGLDVAILCEPNNPTGITTEPTLLRRILARCVENNILLMVDECFTDLLPCPENHTLLGELSGHANLLLLRAFTKQYALAGVRLGYALSSNGALLDAMRASGPPWAVSTLAQAAGLAALKETAYVKAMRTLLAAERPYLRDGLAAFDCRRISGEANYLFFSHADTRLAEKMRRNGVLLRDCSNYEILSPGWYRAAVRGREENDMFLQAMKEALSNG